MPKISECPCCGKADAFVHVYDSRTTKEHRRRRQRCNTCDCAFTTYEITEERYTDLKLIETVVKSLVMSLESLRRFV